MIAFFTICQEYVALVVCHEAAHQWFGNLVTMEWWTHLWLNEGFASFMENLTTDVLYPEYRIWDQFVTATMIEPGQVIAQGVPAIRLAKIESREAVASIPEFLIDRVKTATATVSLWSEPGKSYAAKLRELSPSADPNTRTYLARFTIIDPPADLDFGLTATVTLADPDSERVVRLPLSALFNQGTGPSVFTVDSKTGVLTLKPVDVVAYEASEVLLRKGVEAGDMVVTLGVQKLDASQRVRTVGQ